VLFGGTSKRDGLMLAGRTPGNKMVHVPVPDERTAKDFAGRIVEVSIEEAQTWFLAGHLAGTDS
jgi:tRNA-2-methylthio-N6-dimethylallyladenosine synthase